jgi:isopentenyl-diphosphate delta-isomerase
MEEKVVLVNKNNEVLGLMPKVEAHEKGLLHRAISILLIQQRAKTKYHWPLIWSNAVCSHPRENEDFQDAAQRRLKEELNITCSLKEVYRFIYKAKDEQTGLIEHEYDVVYEGQFDGEIPFNPNEIESIRWIALSSLSQDIEDQPEIYSFWFKEILKNVR